MTKDEMTAFAKALRVDISSGTNTLWDVLFEVAALYMDKDDYDVFIDYCYGDTDTLPECSYLQPS